MENETSDIKRGMLAAKEDYLFYLRSLFEGQDIHIGALHSAALNLHNIRDCHYDPKTVKSALDEAIETADEFTPRAVTDAFVKIYPTITDQTSIAEQVEDALKELEQQSDQDICYQYSTFCSHTLPTSKTNKQVLVTEYPNNKLTISSIGEETLPWGGIPRLIILYLNTMAVKYSSNTISLGQNIKEFVESLGYAASYVEGGTNDQVMGQLEKLYKTEFGHEQQEKILLDNGTIEIRTSKKSFKLFDEKHTFEIVRGNLTERAEATVRLSDTYYKEIKSHPVPLSLETIKSLKKSPLALDLYAFISYRTNTKRLIAIKLKDLMKQFGIEGEAWRFKDKAEKALILVKKYWPECNVLIKNNAMVIIPSKTQVTAR
ncbi:replication protein RepA [Paraglaciecola chathamensis]|uniref:Uncharacterized protein n=1 Tax=Paraglaciecola agarilytica NO2 TaxID=1125747 RepID=A0ABQ0I0Y7_9ALTE|nr:MULTISPECIES: replication protein RepA [Paraglaciecola]MDO6841810.1 replication protein RepA [Paraglaciecola chathamensis]GAC02981.1 hypothetical protein GAGA_0116 [Paraglaciecola agarilytica NO2]|tara:strand:+ start:28883 stop:30004 length:1122 start_codon:yes stop_codon:yes gene_type:complete